MLLITSTIFNQKVLDSQDEVTMAGKKLHNLKKWRDIFACVGVCFIETVEERKMESKNTQGEGR